MISPSLHSTSIRPHAHNLRLLAIYLYVRVVIGLLLLALQLSSGVHSVLGAASHELFIWTVTTYVATTVLSVIMWPPHRLRFAKHRLIGSLLFDLSCMLVLLHASGGISSGLGYLILVYVAIAAIFLRGSLALLFAALASVVIVGDAIIASIIGSRADKDLFAAGVLGAILFATSISFQFLTEKIRKSDLQAAEQSAYAEQLQKLAQAIITRMRTGVIVLDNDSHIELINDAAKQLLDFAEHESPRDNIFNKMSALKNLIEEWQKEFREQPHQDTAIRKAKPALVVKLNSGQEVRISSALIQLGDNQRTVLYVEDNRRLNQQAQQLKLASLGRLTASIAHEIRNPLGAISHAAQLLHESEHIAAEDSRLLEIILQHSDRVNNIIENTLSLSRRRQLDPQVIDLVQWLPQFKTLYNQGNHVDLTLVFQSASALVKVDVSHLTQILMNLCDNGARYNAITQGVESVTLRTGINPNNDTAYIEVIDYGPGVPVNQQEEIFNPFFTTDSKGTGLGLYICQELCEINQAVLTLKPNQANSQKPAQIPSSRTLAEGESDQANPGTCFRIDFSHYQRMN